MSVWSCQSSHSFQVLLLFEPESLPSAPALPQDKALPRLSVLLGCSWCSGITVLLSDPAGIWAGIYFHGQVPKLEASWCTSKKRGCGRLQRQAPWHGIVLMPWVSPSSLHAGELHPPSKTLRRGVLREAECLSYSALTVAEGLAMIAPDLIVQTTIYLPSVCTELSFKQNRHMLFVTVMVSAKLQALHFQHFLLLSKNWSGEIGRSYLHCLAWIFLVTLQPFIFREFYLRIM